MSVALPAPGGSVGLKTFLVYVVGATAGITVYNTVISPRIDDKYENYQLPFGISSGLLFAGAFAIMGAALSAKLLDKVAK